MAERPRRADVAGAYDLGVDAYEALWSPVILPPAVAVVEAFGLPAGAQVVDVGAGTGGLLPAIREHGTGASVMSVDASEQMLRVARRDHQARAVQADALALPVAAAVADAVLLAFVLFHLADPPRALREAARILRPGGRVGTVTWTREGSVVASAVFERMLTEAGAPAPPLRRVDAGLNSAEAIEATLGGAGVAVDKVWLVGLHRQWDPEAHWRLLTGGGVNRSRLAALDKRTRDDALAEAKRRLAELPADGFSWWGEVVCAVASKL